MSGTAGEQTEAGGRQSKRGGEVRRDDRVDVAHCVGEAVAEREGEKDADREPAGGN